MSIQPSEPTRVAAVEKAATHSPEDRWVPYIGYEKFSPAVLSQYAVRIRSGRMWGHGFDAKVRTIRDQYGAKSKILKVRYVGDLVPQNVANTNTID